MLFFVDTCVQDGELCRFSTYTTGVARDLFLTILGANWRSFDCHIGFYHGDDEIHGSIRFLDLLNLGKDTEIISLTHFFEELWVIL